MLLLIHGLFHSFNGLGLDVPPIFTPSPEKPALSSAKGAR
jgi:hypothetical protein